MATIVMDGVEHKFADNPKLQGENWEAEFPPIVSDAPFLRCKFTGQIYPNTEEFAERSDILEPYYGEAVDVAKNSLTVPGIDDTLGVLDPL